MTRPLLYEINTRCWLRELSGQRRQRIDLGCVPDSEFERWRLLGFTHIWLMGVWTTGPRARDLYLGLRQTRQDLREFLPDWREEDVPGSPYAIAEYRVPESLGGEAGLRTFRGKLHGHGLKLLLDFVPNHVGLDHRWVRERPEFLVQSPVAAPEAFPTEGGPRWLAHGKDPYFPAWLDTVQLDYRRAETRAAVLDELRSVSQRSDGVRCDMAMLVLQDVFARNWAGFPSAEPAPASEFWAEAMAALKRPGFLFVAEAYWDLEERLQSLGFDFTYDKRVTDFTVERRWADLLRHLHGHGAEFRQHSVHFLENHDEPRIADRLSLAEHRAAALLVLGLPGLCLLYEGQLTGARFRVPVQFGRRPAEPIVPEIASLYEELLTTLPRTAVGRERGRLLRPLRVSPEDATADNLIVVCWPAEGGEFDLVVVNLTANAARGRLKLPGPEPGNRTWQRIDWLGDKRATRLVDLWQGEGSLLEVPACAAQLLRLQPAS